MPAFSMTTELKDLLQENGQFTKTIFPPRKNAALAFLRLLRDQKEENPPGPNGLMVRFKSFSSRDLSR